MMKNKKEKNQNPSSFRGDVAMRLPESRPLLMINHNAKAGGGSILATIREFKQCEIIVKHGEEDFIQELLQDKNTVSRLSSSSLSRQQKRKKKKVNNTANDCFVHIKENASSGFDDRQYGYVIGSVREPCSHFVSWWSWKSSGGGGLSDLEPTFKDLLGRDNAPYFNSTEDVQRFQQFVQTPGLWEQIGRQFRHSYGPQAVDCWVVVEDFSRSLLNCLQLYERQGGSVNWTAPSVAGLLEKEEERKKEEEESGGDSLRRHRQLRTQHQQQQYHLHKDWFHKNDPLSNPQSNHHAPCHTYFDNNPSLAKKLRDGPAKIIYEQFGYEGCCSKEFDRSTVYYNYDDDDNKHEHHHYGTNNVSSLIIVNKGGVGSQDDGRSSTIILSSNVVMSLATFLVTALLLMVLLYYRFFQKRAGQNNRYASVPTQEEE